MCLITVKDDIIRCIRQQLTEFHPRDDHHEHLSLLFCELTAVKIYTFRLLWHSTELDACQRSWLVLCSLTLSLSLPQPWSKRFTTTQLIILDELSSTRLQLRSSCLTLCHNTRQAAFHSLPQQFLMNSPDTFSNDNDYIVGRRQVRSLKVVNDHQWCSRARRGLDSGVHWSPNQKKHFLLQVIENVL